MAVDAGPIRRRKLSDDVRERLLALIQDELAPGDRLPSERELMTEYGVGRPAIREALQSLQSMGLIDVRHGERPRVAQPTMASAFDQLAPTMRHVLAHSRPTLEHLKEARLVLERHLSRVAAANHRPDDIERLRDVLRRQREAIGDPCAFRELDGRFHQHIAELSGNPVFTAVCSTIFGWLSAFHEDTVLKRGLENLTLAEHESILKAIESGDGELAAEEMGHHLSRANALYSSANAD